MEKNSCFPVGEQAEGRLSLVEEIAQEYTPELYHHPQEKPTEHITKIISTKDLLRELWESKKKVAALESELDYAKNKYGGRKIAKNKYGGRKMGFGSKLLMAGTFVAAAYGLVGMTLAQDENKRLNNEMFTTSEMVELDNLKIELGTQLKAASDYLERFKDGEAEYRQLSADSVVYIKNSMPAGELEESAAMELDDLIAFFSRGDSDAFISRAEKCREAHKQVHIIGSTKFEVHDGVKGANAYCAMEYNAMANHSGDVADALASLKASVVEPSHIKGRDDMLARINRQLELRPGLAEEGAYLGLMFAKNNGAGGVIPVAVQPPYKHAE